MTEQRRAPGGGGLFLSWVPGTLAGVSTPRRYRGPEQGRPVAARRRRGAGGAAAGAHVFLPVQRDARFGPATRRFGMPRGGRGHEFTTVNGRACSHTTPRRWETCRLVGTLAGHLDAYRAPGLPPSVTVERAAALPAGTAVPADRRPRPPARPPGQAGWWGYEGPLAVVFAGGPASTRGDLVLPVRLPTGAGRWGRLVHYLADPARWHKVNLLRFRDPGSPGGWRYEAHLVVLVEPYASPGTVRRPGAAGALDRVGGVDGNVRNLSLVSLPAALPATSVAGVSDGLCKEGAPSRRPSGSRREH